MQIRRRQEDGTFGPLEDVFATNMDELTIMLFEAITTQQEQIIELQAQIAELKGGEA